MTTIILNTRRLELFLLLVFTVSSINCMAQKATSSILVNFGRQLCSSPTSGSDLTLFDNAQSVSPGTLLQCNTSSTIGDVYSKFISYNSINNKLYINDIGERC